MDTPSVVTTSKEFRATATDVDPGTRIPVEVRVEVEDPFEAYRRARDGPGGVILETTGGQPGWGYFAVDPVETMTARPTAAMWDESNRDRGIGVSGHESPSLAALQGLLDGETLVRGECSVPYPCGAFGWFSYDLIREIEDLPERAVDDRSLPHLQVGVYDRVAAWEEPRAGKTTLRITACPQVDPADPDRAYETGRERALALATAALKGDPAVGSPPVTGDTAEFTSDCGQEAFAGRVRTIKEYIRAGDTFQTNVSQRLTAPAAVHPVDTYAAVRSVNPAPYSALLEFPAADLVSASPELLLEREGDRIETEPIAGTRPRGATEAEDEALEAELTGDEKERAEHAMLVDLERNDLGKVAQYGSVDVSEYRRVDRYSEVMHLVSRVGAKLQADATLADAIAAVFPGGTITGAPKPRTMELIDEVEATRRGPYTGSIGVLGFDGRATLNIVIRTLVRQVDEYHLRVGAGIVHDSEPEQEYAETLDKARALVRAVDEALGEQAAMELDAGGGES
ncbi:aminodeoxychorismate synthase, component I [Natranaeroarchaeum aerophilus]|uniref:anthranilate synthase n=1 Tax=Natranaeroarchaeum aerophilus TaxID=2917711 RepID=A0AAE3FS05_9EURY|nr:aminodeoxychorismate synthase, component I [Natranaeroarchaeum aerophilus]MCL9814253.1 aminodeoxychorismate synthase, component I [Natranaeroarchaeum aerophilus]